LEDGDDGDISWRDSWLDAEEVGEGSDGASELVDFDTDLYRYL
jgi:hypothetical protein